MACHREALLGCHAVPALHCHMSHPQQMSLPLPSLQGITGCFRPGVLTALMGSSGAGKVRGEQRLVKWSGHVCTCQASTDAS